MQLSDCRQKNNISEEIKVKPQSIIDSSKGIDISIVIPVFNEGKSVGLVLDLISEIDWYPYRIETIAVDDGSTDETAEVIRRYPYVKYLRHQKNMGKGAALKTGFARAKGRVVVVQDADMEYSPEILPELVKPILLGQADVVYGSRFTGKSKGMSLSHYMGNKLLSLTARLLFEVPITDIMTGSKAFSRAVMDSFQLDESGFEVEIEMTSKTLQNGWRFNEIPIGYSYRTEGESKIGFKDGVKSLFRLFTSVYNTPQINH